MSKGETSIHARGGLSVEYAVSNRSTCKTCNKAIGKDSMRIAKETRSDYHDGFDTTYHHYKCCNKSWGPSFSSITELKEWEILRWEDQVKIKKDLGEKSENSAEEKEREKKLKDLWKLRDELSKVNTKYLKAILEANGMEVKKVTPARLQHKVADGMLWGRVGPCPECKNQGSLRYTMFDYICKTGWISSFTRCEFRGKDGVERFKWVIPKDIKDADSFLKKWKPPKDHPTKTLKDEDADSDEDAEEEEEEEEEGNDNEPEDEIPEGMEMYGMIAMVAGNKKDLGMTQDEMMELIEKHGGETDLELMTDTTMMIAPESEVTKKRKTKKVQLALKEKLPIFTPEYVMNLVERKEEGLKLRQIEHAKKYLAPGSEIREGHKICKKYNLKRIEKEKEKEEKQKKKQEEKENKKKNRKKRKRKQPVAGSDILKVDPDSGHSFDGEILVTHDDEYGYTPYNVMMNVSDLSTGANKYYKIQLIKIKGKQRFIFFTSWGRVGTEIGDSRVYEKKSQKAAIDVFAEKFEQCTGHKWEDRDIFQKKPGRYFMVNLDDGNDEDSDEDDEEMQALKKRKIEKQKEMEAMETDAPAPTLDPRVTDFVNLIFDKDMMKNTLKAMDIDIKKMPLGKIQKKQIKDGYKVLSEIQTVLQEKEPSRNKLRDLSTQFYTLIPHNFGTNAPPLLDNEEMLKKKLELLETLLDLEIAGNIMKETKGAREDEQTVENYKALKLDMKPVDKDSDLYELLKSYAEKTHDTNYFGRFTFEVQDIFEVNKESEKDRFEKWKENENRVLLWHGSRLTNWVGILSTGLRIAPPEAPKTGYRFGKGVYFADVISKSASYCFTSNENPMGVMLLAEVALGKMNELTRDEYMEKAPKGTHCTKALGQTAPDPKTYQKIPEDVTVPVGKPVSTGIRSACSHNEYIVYDVSQIRTRYVLQLKFQHKGWSF